MEIPDGGAEGVLLSQGSAAGGYSLFVKDGNLHYVHNYVGRALHGVSSPEALPAGTHDLRFEFEPTGLPVTPDYTSPFTFTGTIHKVTVDVSGEVIDDAEAELRAHMARQ